MILFFSLFLMSEHDEIMQKLFELVKSEHIEVKKKVKQRRKRTYTPEQRKVMLDNLRKGREAKKKKREQKLKELHDKHINNAEKQPIEETKVEAPKPDIEEPKKKVESAPVNANKKVEAKTLKPTREREQKSNNVEESIGNSVVRIRIGKQRLW